MLNSLFDSSTVPVLEQVVNFTQVRHGVLAGNIANIDTPGYKTRDISPALFQEELKEAIDTRKQAAQSPTYAYNAQSSERSARNRLRRHGQGTRVDEEHPLPRRQRREHRAASCTEISKNQGQHNLALSLMTAQFRLLRAAITERA